MGSKDLSYFGKAADGDVPVFDGATRKWHPEQPAAGDPGASGPLVVEGPFAFGHDSPNIDTTGVDLFTTQAGDVVFGGMTHVIEAFTDGERLNVGTPDMLADSDHILNPAGSYADYSPPGVEGTYQIGDFRMGGTWAFFTPSPTVVRVKAETGGNPTGQAIIHIFVLRLAA